MEQEHYVCTGTCGGVAGEAKICATGGCSKEGEPLMACTCQDMSHEDRLGKGEEKEESPKE